MSKSFQVLVFLVFLLVFAQSLSPFEADKISFSPIQIQYKSNELKNYSETIEIGVDSKYHQDMIVGYKGSLIFTTEFNPSTPNIFDQETIEQETSFTTIIIDENQRVLNTTCRFWKPTDEIRIICDANFFEKGRHSVRIGNQSFEYRNKYLINVNFYGEKDFTLEKFSNSIPIRKTSEYSLPENDNFTELYIREEDNQEVKYIGYRGILNFVIDFNDSVYNIFNPSDIEEKTAFETNLIVDNDNIIYVNCKLWKPIDEKLNMFCKLDEALEYGEHSFFLKTSSFTYNGQKFLIFQTESLFLYHLNEILPFLYSSKQTLYIDENINTYYLTFKYCEYDEDYLMIPGEGFGAIIILDECFKEGKELKCKIKKEVIEEYVSYNGQKLSIFYSFPISEQRPDMSDLRIHSIYGVYINYPLRKQDISVEIVKLLEDNIDMGNFIAYETNVKDINNIHAGTFRLSLSNKDEINCCLKKTIGISLTLICMIDRRGYFSLAKVENKTVLNDINIKYNFIIQPINNNEKFNVSEEGSIMMFSIPKVLNFTLEERITVDFGLSFPEYSNGIKFNPEANDLECVNINTIYKRCMVPKSHFSKKNSGYYYTHHANYFKKSIIFYESSPLEVILPGNEIFISINKENNKDKIILKRRNAVFALVTDYNNKEKKIFDSNVNITFPAIFIYKRYDEEYFADCRLWVPKEDNLRIICKSDNYFDYSDIYLNDTVIFYKDYRINIEQKESIEFELCYDDYIPFLYSDRQTLNINNNVDLYELKFNIEEYYNEPLYIYGSNNNYVILDICEKKDKELICKISKEKIEEILVFKNEQFKIGAMNENYGIISFNNILDITIN